MLTIQKVNHSKGFVLGGQASKQVSTGNPTTYYFNDGAKVKTTIAR